MTSTTIPRDAVAATLSRLMKGAYPYEEKGLTDTAIAVGLMWRCVCKAINGLDADECRECGKARLWIKDVIPEGHEYGELLEDLRAALKDWFDGRPRVRRPAAIGFRVTTEYDDGAAWATWDTTAYFSDASYGREYPEDFERSFVSEALIEISDYERPQDGDTLRVAIPAI